MSSENKLYSDPSAMEPLLPGTLQRELADLTGEIFTRAGFLSAQIPSPEVRKRAAHLVREMNSYYSNLIEGHKTLPRDIERAMRQEFSSNPEKRANQHLNFAHIEVEKLMVERLQKDAAVSIHSADFLCWLHREFYERLPKEMHWRSDRNGQRHRIEPGVLRGFEVEVGAHQPPQHESLPRMLSRFEEVYSSRTILATEQLVALGAAHHRLA
jgi:Fic family protein